MDRNVPVWKTLFLCTGRTYSLLSVGIRSVLILKDANERKLFQAGRTNIAVYAPNLRYVLCT